MVVCLIGRPKRTNRQKVFTLLKEGYSQGSIGRKLHISSQAVGYYIDEFEHANLIVCDDKNAYIRTYRFTPLGRAINVTIFTEGTKQISLKKIAISRQGPPTPSNNIHRICRKMKVLSEPKLRQGLKWNNIAELANGVIQKYLFYPNKKEDHITFRYQPGKDDFGELVFWVPEKKLDSNEWAFWYEYLKEEVGHVYALAMRLLQCNLALPEEYQPLEFAVPARTEAQRRACKLRLECGRAYTDWSQHGLPDKIRGEFETRDPAVAEALDILVNAEHLIPQRMGKLEKMFETWKEVPLQINMLEKENKAIIEMMNNHTDAIKKIDKLVEDFQSWQKKMLIVNEKETYESNVGYV